MTNRDALTDLALDYLRAVAQSVDAEMGGKSQRLQRSVWLVSTGSIQRGSKYFERTTFDRIGVDIFLQKKMHEGLGHPEPLIDALAALGIPRNQIHYGALLPLVRHWLRLPDPLAFQEDAISDVLREFVDFAIGGIVHISSRQALIGLTLDSGPVVLQEGVVIRPISEEELWEIGDDDRIASFFGPLVREIPGEDWYILDIKQPASATDLRQANSDISAIRQGVLIALRLLAPSRLNVLDLGFQSSYGMSAAGRQIPGGYGPGFPGFLFGNYVLDAGLTTLLKSSWPRLRQIMTSKGHFLRLPAQRLADGGNRHRDDDAIVDYAIGLEALLTEGAQHELGYRFALRGAMIQAWDDQDASAYYKTLRDFYKMRSLIVHGVSVDPKELSAARVFGDVALRQIWWWYFDSRLSLRAATSRVDKRILKHHV
jgi:hypothetical protein